MALSPLQILERVDAVIRNTHAVGTTGIHLDTYVDISVLRHHPGETAALCRNIADHADDVDVVVGPAGGADFIVRGVARHLSSILGHRVRVVLAKEADAGNFQILPSDQYLVRERRVLCVDDVLNTGSTLRHILAPVRMFEGKVMGVGVVCSHGLVGAEELGIPWVYAATQVHSRRWTPKECLVDGLCKAGIPVNTRVGHGAAFLAKSPLNGLNSR